MDSISWVLFTTVLISGAIYSLIREKYYEAEGVGGNVKLKYVGYLKMIPFVFKCTRLIGGISFAAFLAHALFLTLTMEGSPLRVLVGLWFEKYNI